MKGRGILGRWSIDIRNTAKIPYLVANPALMDKTVERYRGKLL